MTSFMTALKQILKLFVISGVGPCTESWLPNCHFLEHQIFLLNNTPGCAPWKFGKMQHLLAPYEWIYGKVLNIVLSVRLDLNSTFKLNKNIFQIKLKYLLSYFVLVQLYFNSCNMIEELAVLAMPKTFSLCECADVGWDQNLVQSK